MKITVVQPIAKGIEGIHADELVAEYRFDELTGDVLLDYSGNGNHGAFGLGNARPERTSTGITFFDDYITLPNAVRDALSVSKEFTVITAGLVGKSGGSVLGSAISATDRFILNASPGMVTSLSPYLKNMRGCLNTGTTTVTQFAKASGSFDVYSTSIFTYCYNPTFLKGKMIIGNELYGNVSAANPSNIIGCRIGAQTSGAPFLVGTLYYMLIYSKFLNNSLIRKQHRVIKKILKHRGVVI